MKRKIPLCLSVMFAVSGLISCSTPGGNTQSGFRPPNSGIGSPVLTASKDTSQSEISRKPPAGNSNPDIDSAFRPGVGF